MTICAPGTLMGYSGPADDIGSRVAYFAHVNRIPAKEIARIAGVEERRAKQLRNGAPPTSAQLVAMARAWGWSFVHFVYQPLCGDEAIAADKRDIDELRTTLGRLEARLAGFDGPAAQMVGTAASDPGSMAPGTGDSLAGGTGVEP